MSTENQDKKELVVRLPGDLHAQVKERAEQEERSMASTIRFALRQYLKTSPAV
jgi:hypothetical protein